LGFVLGELALIAGLRLAVGNAADAAEVSAVEYVAGNAALLVVHTIAAPVDVPECLDMKGLPGACACGQQQEAGGEAGHSLTSSTGTTVPPFVRWAYGFLGRHISALMRKYTIKNASGIYTSRTSN